MNKQLQFFLLLAIISLSSSQLNAQTVLTVTDVVEVQDFALGTGLDLTAADAAIVTGTGTLVNQPTYVRYTGTSSDFASNLTFDLKSTTADVTASITFELRKRRANNLVGNVTVGGIQTNVTLAGTNASTFTDSTDGTTANTFEDVVVVLDPITLTSTAQTIVVNFTTLETGTQASGNPQVRFESISINKTALLCGPATDVTTLAASAGAEYIDLSWVDPTCFDEVLVVAKEATAVTFASPTGDGSLYTDDAAFGTVGTDANIVASEFAVYKGAANNVIVSGLTKNGTTYHFAVFTRIGTDWSAGVTVSATTNNTYTSIDGVSGNPTRTWEAETTWLGGAIPTNAVTDNVIIRGRVNIASSDVVVNDLTIDNVTAFLERVSVIEGNSLTIKGDVVTANQLQVNANSTSTGSLIIDGTVTGNIRFNRYVNSNATGNDLISAPVPVTFSSIAGELFENPTTTTQKLFGPFDNSTGVYENWDTATDGATTLVQGKGYRAGHIDGDEILFTGSPVSPAVDVPVSITDETATGTGNYKRWNLIGNPFPSYLDFAAFFTENSSQLDAGAYQAIYGYDADDSNGSNFTIWNAFNTTDKVTPGQGFFVRAKTGGGTITFKPAMRTTGASDDFIAGRSATTSFVLSELFLSNGSSTYNTKIYFSEDKTRGLDPGYDAAAFTGSTNSIYTNLVEDNEGLEFAIQALSYNDLNDVVVPLGVNSDAGIQLTIGLNTATATIPSNINVYLEDNVANTWTLLNNSDYIFAPSAELSGTGRFFVHFTPTTLSTTKDNLLNGINIYSEQISKTVVINGQLNTDTTAVIYDMQGRLVLQQALNTSNTTNAINVNALKTGVYIVELKSKAQSRTQKVIIN
ncbi:T9SS type A sorting domain-containing protein [Winogradskyella sp. Asnod2-B02-A]|uniref:T9SS type A sorting domain-containing protein n=1 Tax=Winogradskyella sp. Asnod2-B02-A TaxID=3160583 RepID=UPI00386CC41C